MSRKQFEKSIFFLFDHSIIWRWRKISYICVCLWVKENWLWIIIDLYVVECFQKKKVIVHQQRVPSYILQFPSGRKLARAIMMRAVEHQQRRQEQQNWNVKRRRLMHCRSVIQLWKKAMPTLRLPHTLAEHKINKGVKNGQTCNRGRQVMCSWMIMQSKRIHDDMQHDMRC